MDFKKLKSGSDVRGVAMGENAVLTPAVAQTLGRAFVAFLSQKLLKKPEQLTIAVGRDSRLSGPQLLGAVLEGITTTGATAADYEMCTTPSMYMAILTEGFQPDASIMITASHHPWQLNGLKFFTKEGGLGFHELDEVLEIAQHLEPAESDERPGKVLHTPFLPTYQKHLEELIISGVDPEVQIPTILGKSGLPVFLLGKVADVVTNNYGTSIPMVDTASVLQRTLEIVKEQETAFICTNVQETDLCGHRENVAAYADRLRVADEWIGKIRDALGEDDILIVQADHGNDPTIGHPHHTREMVPLMIHSAHSTPKNIGIRKTLSDVGATAADYFHSKAPENGTSFLPLLLK